MVTTQDVLELMQRVAAEVITPRFRALAAEEIEQKNPGDFVTVADRESEVLLTRELRRMFPGALVVGEEACFANPELEYTLAGVEHGFTVDPVDGTKNFVAGSPDHAVMIAEVVNGEQTRGWIWQPEHEVSFVAEKGAGVERNGERLVRGPVQELPVGATSKRPRHGFDGSGLLAPVERSAWCCGIDYPKVVTGELDFLVYTQVHPWDHLPGTLMVREIGGAARRWDGIDYTPDWPGPGLLSAATPELWSQVQRVWGEPDL